MKKRNFKIGKMVYDTDEIKQMAKDSFKKNYKILLGIVVAVVTIIAGTASLKSSGWGQKTAKGVCVTLANVMYEAPAFSGEVFGMTCIPYENRMNAKTQQQQEDSQMQYSQMQDILAAKREEIMDEVVISTVMAEAPDPVEVASLLMQENGFSLGNIGNVSYTYADENGTYEYLGEYLLTAYCPCPICCGKYSNMTNPITASGNPAVQGITVAGPPEMAFGTQLVIDGVIYTVQDRGGAIQGKHLDIYFSTHEQAVQFGRKTSAVYLYSSEQ